MVGTTLGLQNQTEVQTYYYMKSWDPYKAYIVGLCVMMVILVMGLIGNGLVIFVTSYKMKTTVNSIWFLNLAITDLIFIPIVLYNISELCSSYRFISDLMFKFGYHTFHLNMFASAFFLTVISLDRCLCTWVVVWAQNKRTLVKARIICVFVWLLAICCSIPSAIYIYKPTDTFQQMSISPKFLFTYMFMLGFLIPFMIITSSYIAIFVRVRRFPRGNQLRIFRVIFVILAFFTSCFPFHFQNFLSVWAPYIDLNFSVSIFIQSLVFLNSCLNPILYVFMCDEYRTKLKKSLLLVLEGAFTEDHLGLH